MGETERKMSDQVQCDICKEDFRATPSHINLICKGCQNKEKKGLIEDFRTIRDKVLLQMREKYGYTAKGNEYLESLFKEQFKKWEAKKDG